MTERQLGEWWKEVHSAIMEILYRYDPLGTGSTVAAPDDEYFDEASRTIRSVLDLAQDWGLRQAIESRWPGAEPAMLDELETAWRSPPKSTP